MSPDDIKKLLTSKDPELVQEEQKVSLWRTATESRFGDVVFKVLNHKPEDRERTFHPEDRYAKFKKKNSKWSDPWIHRIPRESQGAYLRRLLFVKDLGWSQKIITTYRGFFNNGSIDYDIKGPAAVVEKIRKNIDGNGTSIEDFFDGLIFDQLFAVNKAYILTDSPTEEEKKDPTLPDKLPYSFIVKREQVLDIGKNEFSELELFRYANEATEVVGLEKNRFVDFWGWTLDSVFKLRRQAGKKTGGELSQAETPDLQIDGRPALPIVCCDLKEDPSPINLAALIQLDQANLLSEIRFILSMIAIAIPYMPSSMAKSLEDFAVDSLAEVPDNYTGIEPGYLAYPDRTLTPHFSYFGLLTELVHSLSNLKRKDTKAAETERSKTLDFMDVRAVLIFLVDTMTKIGEDLGKVWTAYVGEEVTIKITAQKDSFDIKGLREDLEEIMLMLSSGYGPAGQAEFLKSKVDAIYANLAPEKRDEIRDEVDKIFNQIQGGATDVEALANLTALQERISALENPTKTKKENPTNETKK